MSEPVALGGGMQTREILQVLPHRYPMLLVDRVESVEPGRRLRAIKCVTANEPIFTGHFPGAPIFPGVLLVEAMAQAAGILAFHSLGRTDAARSGGLDAAGKSLYLLGVDGARFRRPVVPGDRLEIDIEVVQRRASVWKVAGTVRVDGHKAAEAVLLVGLVDGEPGKR